MNMVRFGGGILVGSYQEAALSAQPSQDTLETQTWHQIDQLKRQNIPAEALIFTEDQWQHKGHYYLVATQQDALDIKALNLQEQKVVSTLKDSTQKEYYNKLVYSVRTAFQQVRNHMAYLIYNKALRGETDV